MRRRALLASAAAGVAGVAGCSTVLSTDGTGNGSDGNDSGGSGGDDPPTAEPPKDDPPDGRSSVIDLETIDRTYAFVPTAFRTDDDARIALWFDRTATSEAPARVVGWLRNENEYENTFDLEWIPTVGDVHSRTLTGYDHTSRLHLAPTAANEIAETVPNVSRNEDGLWRVDDLGPWMAEHVRLDPGERVRLEYRVVGEPDMPGRPTGTYEFRGDDETVRLAVWDADAPGETVDSRFAGRDVPPIHEESTIHWYHETDESTVAYLRPERERLELDGALEFDLVYNARESTGCGHWNIYKLVDREWFHVGPRGHTSDCRSVAPGARMDWTLRAFNGSAIRCDCGYSCGDGMTRGHLGPGTYAVVAGYAHPADESGALVELVGDPVALEPTDSATIERDGAEVVVTTDAYGNGEHPEDGTVTVERAGDDDGGDADREADRVVVEQLMGGGSVFGGSSALRNALAPFEDGVERVVLRTDEYGVDDAVEHDASERHVAFRGETYRLTADRSAE
jgi:hypothetical protein